MTTVYTFSPSTGELVGEIASIFSTLDKTELMPSYGTKQVPPVVTTNQRAVFRDLDDKVPLIEALGRWKVIPDFRGQTYWLPDSSTHTITELGVSPPPDASFEVVRTIEQVRADHWKKLKKARDFAEFGVFAWNGHDFDADAISRSRLTLAFLGAQKAQATNDATWRVDWRVYNNTTVSLSADDVVNVMLALGEHTLQVHEHSNQLWTLLEAADTKEEIEAIVW